MNKSKQEWEAEQRSKNPAITQQELDSQWKSQNPGWAQSLASTILHPIDAAGKAGTAVAERSRASGYRPEDDRVTVKVPSFGSKKEPTLAETVNASRPTKPDLTPAKTGAEFDPLVGQGTGAFRPEEEPATAPASTEPTTLASTLAAPPTAKDAPVGNSEARRNYNRINKELLGYKAKELPEDVTQDIRAELKKAYEDKVSRNDWAEVATNLINAMATYGAAVQAGDKSSGAIKLSPGVDYNARSDRAAREYSSGLSEQDKILATKQRAVDSSNDNDFRNLSLRQKLAKDDADFETDTAKEKARTAPVPGSLTDLEKQQHADLVEERKANRVLNTADQETIDKITKYQGLEAQIKAVDPKNTKLRNALIQQLTKLSGGLSPEEEATATTQAHAKDDPSRIPFMGTVASEEDEKTAVRAVREERLRDIQKRMSGRNVGQTSPSGNTAPSTGKTDQKPVSVRHKPSGETRQFPAGSVELQNALQNPEFEIVR